MKYVVIVMYCVSLVCIFVNIFNFNKIVGIIGYGILCLTSIYQIIKHIKQKNSWFHGCCSLMFNWDSNW